MSSFRDEYPRVSRIFGEGLAINCIAGGRRYCIRFYVSRVINKALPNIV